MVFVGASILLVLAAWPDMIYRLSRSITQGKKASIQAAAGINLGPIFTVLLPSAIRHIGPRIDAIKMDRRGYLTFPGIKALATTPEFA